MKKSLGKDGAAGFDFINGQLRSHVQTAFDALTSKDFSVRAREAVVFSNADVAVAAAPVSRLGDVKTGAAIGAIHLASNLPISTKRDATPVAAGTYIVYARMASGCGAGAVMLRQQGKKGRDITIPLGAHDTPVAQNLDSTHECTGISNVHITLEGLCVCVSWDCDRECHVPVCFCIGPRGHKEPVS